MRINSGKYKGRALAVPKGGATRPTFTKLKQSLFNICSTVIEDAEFLDLFAGAGAIGLEAISRGASQATFVENDRKALHAIHENIELLNEKEHTRIFSLDVFEALPRLIKAGKRFDIIFADPPYGTSHDSLSNDVLKIIDGSELLKRGGWLFLEDAVEASKADFELKTLSLKSERKMGRALLRQYVLKEDA